MCGGGGAHTLRSDPFPSLDRVLPVGNSYCSLNVYHRLVVVAVVAVVVAAVAADVYGAA